MTETPAAYEREPYRSRLETEVTTVGTEGDRPFAVLADTLLYPEGGGQPEDLGRLGDVAVLGVRRTEGGETSEIRHYLERPVEPGPVTVELDWQRRYDHMQQHTAQHLLSALAEDRFGWVTTAFHLGAERSDVELAVSSLSPRDLATLEEGVATEIRAARPVTARRVKPERLAQLEVRSRGLPEGHRGNVRLVEIEGIDLNTCGGTHLANTAEIETVKLLSTESMRGGTRLYWVAGSRVRRLLAEHEARNAELRRLLETGDGELVQVLDSKLERLEAETRRARDLERRLAAAVASRLLAGREALACERFEGLGAGFLQLVARSIAASKSPLCALLVSELEGKGALVVVGGEGCPQDVQKVGRRVAEILGARGGGSGSIFQGRVEDPTLLERGAAALRQAVDEAG